MSKPGSGGVASSQDSAIQRRERLRQLAVETADINNDPYFMKNHIGSYECKLCLTLHSNEGSYLAHTQGKRHQQNLARRAAKAARDANTNQINLPASITNQQQQQQHKQTARIGRPGYRVIKQLDPSSLCFSLLFELNYPLIHPNSQPRHRFMSAYEQRVEKLNETQRKQKPAHQYLLFAAEPYQTIAFKIPNKEIDRREGKFFTHWEQQNNKFILQLLFHTDQQQQETPTNNMEDQDIHPVDEDEYGY